MKVAVVGANGRVGCALVDHLEGRYDVNPIVRQAGEEQAELVARAVAGADVVVNAAGVAHVEHPTADDLQRLHAANVELPAALAEACLHQGASLIHISSVKAASAEPDSPYARSKREGDDALQAGYASQFEAAGSSLVIVRPLALLFPPLNAGKVAKLRPIRGVPSVLVPPVRLPVLPASSFLAAIDDLLDATDSATAPDGLSWRDFDRSERGTLRDVRTAFGTMR